VFHGRSMKPTLYPRALRVSTKVASQKRKVRLAASLLHVFGSPHRCFVELEGFDVSVWGRGLDS
jgi:hypothetical protein